MSPIKLDDLLLDPNNPRFVDSLRSIADPLPDSKVEAEQDRILARFRDAKDERNSDDDDDDESFFGIQELMESMGTIGFVPIDRIVVRKLSKSKKYLVIEGNRRVSAAKRLRDKNKNEKNPKNKLDAEILQSLENVDALLLHTDGLSKEQIDEQVGVILGLRHYGAVLNWNPMAKAVNIFKEYVATSPKLTKFKLEAKRITTVAERLSISRPDVKKALKTYIVFEQLSGAFSVPPEPKHYSLIEAVVTNQKLAKHYIDQDDNTFELTEDSLERVNTLCQFEKRDTNEVNILPEPKAVARFARIVEASTTHPEEAVRDFAKNLLLDVEGGQRPLDDALDNLTSFLAVRAWVDALQKLLNKQEKELDPATFEAVGNELLFLEQVQQAFKNIRTILEA